MIKRDANEGEIVEALRGIGCTVQLLHGNSQGTPDLLVGRDGRTFLLEVKAARGRLLASQHRWHGRWRGAPVAIVHTVEEALRAVGIAVA